MEKHKKTIKQCGWYKECPVVEYECQEDKCCKDCPKYAVCLIRLEEEE